MPSPSKSRLLLKKIGNILRPRRTEATIYSGDHVLYSEPEHATSPVARGEPEPLGWPDDIAPSFDGVEFDLNDMASPQENTANGGTGLQNQPTQASVTPPSFMAQAGTNRTSDIVQPPFNLWEETIQAVTDLGVTPDQVSPKVLARFINFGGRAELWYEDAAATMFKSEIGPYKVAIAYIIDASKHVLRPNSSKKKKEAWMQLGGIDFRLQAVANYINSLEKDLGKCKEKCNNTASGRVIVLNASALIEVLGELGEKVEELRETIVYRMIRKHDTAKGNISLFEGDPEDLYPGFF
ncbi:hypothetical protein ABW20_dc0105093 [Dactylellina cionopaga]|nr:hypothetical protein ABW20_dc0105093 [Dactylellina cionopaga]